MALEGTLRDFSLADILQLISLQHKTGLLTVRGPADTVTLGFMDGMLVSAESSAQRLDTRLGTVLVKTRRLTAEALARALELNFSTDSRYDQFLAMAGLEYAVPLWSTSGFFRRGYVAIGGRGVYSTATLGGSRTSYSRTPLSADVALRLDTPVGMFNVSVAYWLDIAL